MMATIQVKLKNGQVVPMSHPDDWTEEQVISSIHENFPDEASNKPEIDEQTQGNQEKTGVSGIKDDFFNALSGAMKSSAQFAKDTPEMLEDLGGQLLEHPVKGQIHAAGQLGSSIAEMGKGLLNMPHDILGYLGKKELIPDWLKRYNELPFTHIQENTGLQSLLGTQPTQKSDRLLRALPELATDAALVKSLVKGGVNKLNQTALKKEASEVDQKIAKATDDLGLTEKQTKQLADKLKEEFSEEFSSKSRIGETTPSGQRQQQNRKNKMIEETKPLLVEKTPEEISNMKPQEVSKKADTDVEQAHQMLSDELQWRDNHAKKGGEIGKSIVKADKDKASKIYNETRDYYVDKSITVPNSKEIKNIKTTLEELKNLDELAPGYGSQTPAQTSLEAHLTALENEKVPARDMYDLSRSVSKKASDIRHKQFSEADQVERNRLGQLADKYESEAKKLNTLLEEAGDSPKIKANLKEANKLWTKYSSLKSIPEGRELYYNGKLTQGFMDAITGDKAGRAYLRDIVENSPELKKNIIGMKYSKKTRHGDLLNPNKAVESYLNDLPNVQSKVDLLKDAQAAKPELKQLAESMKHQANIKQLESEIKFHEKAEKELDVKMKEAEKHGENIARHKKKKEELQEQINSKKGKLKAIRNTALKLTGLKYLSDKVGM